MCNKEVSLRGTWALPALVVALSLALAFVLLPGSSRASALQQQQNTITVPAGGTATFTARGFCLDFGKPFPSQATSVNGLAADNVRAALNYSIQKGYTEGSPDQVELAIWFLRDNTWRNDQHTVAQEIVNNATSANVPVPGSATSLADAVAQNQVTVSGNFTAQTADHFYGDGQVTITNKGTSDLTLYVPIGTIFEVPGAAGNFQTLAVYPLSAPAQVTGTPAVTQTSVVTGTQTITGTATAMVTSSPVATGTVTATTTVTGTIVVTSTIPPIATETVVTGTVVVETPTVEVASPTTAFETPTTEVFAPTATPIGGGELPQTGGGSGNMLVITLLMVAVALAIVGAGAGLSRARKYNR